MHDPGAETEAADPTLAMSARTHDFIRAPLAEHGGSPYGNPLIEERKKFGFASLQTDEFTSASRQFISKEGAVNQRGRVLGGSTAINAGFYRSASKEYIKRDRWDPESAREAYEQAESKIVFRPSLEAWQSVTADCMVEAGIRPFNGFSLEHLQGTKVGGNIFDAHGRRHSSADLLATAGNSNKITHLLNATVQNVIFDDAAHWGVLRSCGVRRKEHLMQFNITRLSDVRAVGQSMQDNPAMFLSLNYSSSHALQQLPTDAPQVAGILNGFRIIIGTSMFYQGFNTSIQPVLGGRLAHPTSRGSLRLVSRDPRQNPSVKFNYLAEEKDLDQCVEAVRLLEKIANFISISAFLGRKQSRISSTRDFCKKV
ncbi:hypothetical protein ACLOJK_029122 [Asimina triloba]